MRAIPTLARIIDLSTTALQQSRDLLPSFLALEPRPMQKPKVRCTGRLASKPQPAGIRTQILVHFQRRAGGPVRVTPKRPGLLRPAWIVERRGLGDILAREHLAQHGQHLFFGLFVALLLDLVGLVRDNSHEDDVRAGVEALCRQRLEHRVLSARCGRRIQEVLCVVRPEGLVELHEDLGVRAHTELVNGCLFPRRQLGTELDGVVLQYAQCKRADGICGRHAATILCVDGDSVIAVFDIRDLGVETQFGVSRLKKCRRFAFSERAVSPGIND